MSKPSSLTRFNQFFRRITGSTAFFVASLGLLIIHALWLAVTAIYPLPFDEYYHIGIIKIYAEQWSPFIAQQPAEASLYGDITRTPSYLYHYLMSFPYRVIETLIPSEEGQIIALRLINIALMALAVYLFWRLFLKMGISKRTANITVFFFALTPIVPFLAAHVNYDNLMLPLAVAVFLLGWRILQTKKPAVTDISALMILILFGSLVKETLLLLGVIVSIYVGIALIHRYRSNLYKILHTSIKSTSKTTLTVLAGLLIIGGGLFLERYGVNQLSYGSWRAECQAVQSTTVCEQFAPWRRNQRNLTSNNEPLYGNIASYSQHWVSKISRGNYAIFSHTPTEVVSEEEPFGPIVLKALLPLPIIMGIFAVSGGLVLLVINHKKILGQSNYRYLLIIGGVFVATAWLFNYSTYSRLGAAQAIQARYLLPVMLPLLITLVAAWTIGLKNLRIKYILLTIFGLVYLCHGGAIGWLIRAEPAWYWQNDQVIRLNQQIQDGLKQVKIH